MLIVLKLDTPSKRGPGYWKFNNSLLEDVEYTEYITKVIDNYTKTREHASKQTLWELCKIDIQDQTIAYSKKKSKCKNDRITNLEKQLSELYEQEPKNNNNIRENIRKIELELQTYYDVNNCHRQWWHTK